MLITPIETDLQAQIISRTQYYINLASQLFDQNFQMIPINFNLSGRAAGMYHVQARKRYIRYNPYIFAKYFEDNMQHTVPHEAAHYIADMLYGIKNIKPHGKEWKEIMQQFGIPKARASCYYDLQGIPQRQQQRFTYQCHCRQHEITTRRHNMIMQGQRRYRCSACNTDIKYAAQP